ncbi:MAG: hypothetical protein ABSG04_08635, partial [Verrucomicrobiota bacterium]
RSAPVPGRSNVIEQIRLGKLGCARAVRTGCARGGAHSCVVYPAALAVNRRISHFWVIISDFLILIATKDN